MDTIFDILGAAQGLVMTLVFIGIFACIIYLGLKAHESRLDSLTDAAPGTFTADSEV